MTGNQNEYSYKDKIDIVRSKKVDLETTHLLSSYAVLAEGIKYITLSI